MFGGRFWRLSGVPPRTRYTVSCVAPLACKCNTFVKWSGSHVTDPLLGALLLLTAAVGFYVLALYREATKRPLLGVFACDCCPDGDHKRPWTGANIRSDYWSVLSPEQQAINRAVWADALADPAFVAALEAGEVDIAAGRVAPWKDVEEDRLVRHRQKGLLGRDDKPVFPDTDE